MRIRLEMIDLGNNFGKDRKCVCGEEEEIEHIIECRKVEKEMEGKVSIEELNGGRKEEIKRVVKWIKEYIATREERNNDGKQQQKGR